MPHLANNLLCIMLYLGKHFHPFSLPTPPPNKNLKGKQEEVSMLIRRLGERLQNHPWLQKVEEEEEQGGRARSSPQ